MATDRELQARALNERADRLQAEIDYLREREQREGIDFRGAIRSLEEKLQGQRVQAANILSGGRTEAQVAAKERFEAAQAEKQRQSAARSLFEETQQYFRENPDLLQSGAAVDENVRRTEARRRYRETQQMFAENPAARPVDVPMTEAVEGLVKGTLLKFRAKEVLERKQEGYRFEDRVPYREPVLVKRSPPKPEVTDLPFIPPSAFRSVAPESPKLETALRIVREGARVGSAIAGQKAKYFSASGQFVKAAKERVKQASFKLEKYKRGLELGIVQHPVQTALIFTTGLGFGATSAGLGAVSKATGLVGKAATIGKKVFDVGGKILLGTYVGGTVARFVKSREKDVIVGRVIAEVGAFGIGAGLGGGFVGGVRAKSAETKATKALLGEEVFIPKGRKGLPVIVETPKGELVSRQQVATRAFAQKALDVVPQDLTTTFRVRPIEGFEAAQEQGAGFTRGALEGGKSFRFVKGEPVYLEFKDIPEYQNFVFTSRATILRPILTEFGPAAVENTRLSQNFINLDTFNRLNRGNQITVIDTPTGSSISVGGPEGITLFGFGERYNPRAVMFAKGRVDPIGLATTTEIIPTGKASRSNPFVYRERISRQQGLFGPFDRKNLMFSFEEVLTTESGATVYRSGGFFRATQKEMLRFEAVKQPGKPLKPFVYGKSEVVSTRSSPAPEPFVETKVKGGQVQRLIVKTVTKTKQKVKSLAETLSKTGTLGRQGAKSTSLSKGKSEGAGLSGKSQTAGSAAQRRRVLVLEGVKVRSKVDLGQVLQTGTLGLAAVLSGQNARAMSNVLSGMSQKIDVVSVTGLKAGQLGATLTRAGLKADTAQALIQSLATETATLQSARTVSKAKLVPEVVNVPKVVPVNIKVPRPPPTPGKVPEDNFRVKSDSKGVVGSGKGGFGVYVKRKGKFVRVGPVLVKEAALDLGAKITATSLAAQFKIAPVKERPVRAGVTGSFSRFRPTFRTFKVVKGKKVALPAGQFIEKKQYRLSTRSEVKEIKLAKQKGFLGRGGLL